MKIQYGDYAQWQREWLSEEEMEKEVEYWQGELMGAPVVHSLPLDHERPRRQGWEGGMYWEWMGEEVREGLKRLSQAGARDVVHGVGDGVCGVGEPVQRRRRSGDRDVDRGQREREELEPLIGFFVNNLALRSRWEGNVGLKEALKRQKEMILEA